MTRFFQLTMSRFAIVIFTALCTSTAYAQNATASSPATSVSNAHESDALFQSLGGKTGIDNIVDDLLHIWHNDSRISAKLNDVDLENLRRRLKEQFTHVSGGPLEYKGKDMKTIHDGQDLRNADFNALVEDLQQAMDKNKIPTRVQNKLLAKLAPMQRDIVTK